jgi:hypothetical protein
MVTRSIAVLLITALVSGCGVRVPATNTGGASGDAGTCGRGLVVLTSDYMSSSVSLLDFEGNVVSPSVISSASATTGLSAPLSGDVFLPSMPAHGDALVLIDGYLASVLTWVDVKSGAVRGQLSVATGFAANPQDYIEVSEDLAYVTRYEPNSKPGRQPFDGGNDILVIDPRAREIRSRIDLTAAMKGEDVGLLPRAGRMLRAGNTIYALLDGFSADFKRSSDARVVALDSASGEMVSVTVLKGLHDCRGIAVSPDETELAVACSGSLQPPTAEQSGLVFLSAERNPQERGRFSAATFGDTPLGFTVAYASPRSVIFTTFGTLPGEVTTDDTAIRLDLDSGGFEVLFTSARSPACGASERCPFSIGDVVCAPGCGVCFVADAATDGGSVHRLSVSPEGRVQRDERRRTGDGIGLPPRYLQIF